MNGQTRRSLERLTKELIEQGKLVEAGWIGLRLACEPENAPPDQLLAMRMAFFAGAHHMFNSILSILDPGEDPTDADLRRLELIHAELEAFIQDFELRHTKPQGTA